ncbi:hypothetical protein GCM10027594_06080 [Hymenobacter agri]
MNKLYLFATVFLFWIALAGSLMQLAVAPVRQLRATTFRSMPMHATVVAQANAIDTGAAYN